MTPSPACSRSAWHLIHSRGSPGSWPPRSSSPRGCCDDVRPVITIKPSVIFFPPPFFLNVRVIYPPTNIRRKTRSEQLFSGKEMGERAEPMQWIVARHRQNSGERDEELGDPDTPDRSRRVDVRASGLHFHPTTFAKHKFLGHIYVS